MRSEDGNAHDFCAPFGVERTFRKGVLHINCGKNSTYGRCGSAIQAQSDANLEGLTIDDLEIEGGGGINTFEKSLFKRPSREHWATEGVAIHHS